MRFKYSDISLLLGILQVDMKRLTISVPCPGLVTGSVRWNHLAHVDNASKGLRLCVWSFLCPLPALPRGLQKSRSPLPMLHSFSFPKALRTETKWKSHSVIICTLTEKFMTLCKNIDKYVVCWELKIRNKASYWQHFPWVPLERGWIIHWMFVETTTTSPASFRNRKRKPSCLWRCSTRK